MLYNIRTNKFTRPKPDALQSAQERGARLHSLPASSWQLQASRVGVPALVTRQCRSTRCGLDFLGSRRDIPQRSCHERQPQPDSSPTPMEPDSSPTPMEPDSAEKTGRCVTLVMHGSCNPVHWGHIAMLTRSKTALENLGYEVIAGEIAITRSGYIQQVKGEPAMQDSIRLSLLGLACSPHSTWLSGVDGTKYRSASAYIEGEWPRSDGSTPVSVLGSDVFLRYPCPPQRLIVVIARVNEATEAAAKLKSLGYSLDVDAILLPESEFGHISSTLAREALFNGDDTALRQYCGTEVSSVLLKADANELYTVS